MIYLRQYHAGFAVRMDIIGCACKGAGGTSVELSNVTASARAVYFVTNVDGNTCNAHVEGTTISNGKVYAVLNRQLDTTEVIYINWCKIEW